MDKGGPLLGELGCEDTAKGRRRFSERMKERIAEENEEEEMRHKKIRRGWKFGAEDFVERLEEKVTASAKRGNHDPVQVGETMQAKAERIIREEKARVRMTETRWKKLRKMDKVKVQIARKLRQETTMTLEWIAKRLEAGTSGTLAVALYQERKLNE